VSHWGGGGRPIPHESATALIIIITIITTTIFTVLSFIYGASHMREFTVFPMGQNRSVPGGRQMVGQAANLTFEFACRLLWAEHAPVAMYYYSTIRLILIYRPSEGGRLSRPRHCSTCAARAQSYILKSAAWGKLSSGNLSREETTTSYIYIYIYIYIYSAYALPCSVLDETGSYRVLSMSRS